ncbi:MAG TPA: thioredoxin family protein [Dehalococcoidia bacterium]|nr:thioredoxin family protein [Dehalococcoidia bacterium]
MLERPLLAALLIALATVAIATSRALLTRRDRRTVARLNASRSIEPGPGAPRIIYFTTETCVICRMQQIPALDALQTALPDLQVERHDAIEDGDLAGEYGVLTVPTTAVYNRDGQLVTINRGFTSAAALHSQIEGTEFVLEGGMASASEPVT